MKKPIAHRHLLAAAAVATTFAISAAPARAAVLVTDNVDGTPATTLSAYTFSNVVGAFTEGQVWRAGDSGLTPQAGSSYASFASNSTGHGVTSGTVTLTSGFGSGFLVAAGTYTMSMYVGEGNISRNTFTAFEPFLATMGGTEFTSKTVTTPYVWPNSPTTAEWVLVEVEYEIAGGSPLIGQQFTWGFDAADGTTSRYYTAWDAVSVDFVAVPEPGAALLGGLGILSLLRRRR